MAPALREQDARQLSTQIVAEVQRMGAAVTQVTVSANRDGLLFLAQINGYLAGCQVPPGTAAYAVVATELLHNALTAGAVGSV